MPAFKPDRIVVNPDVKGTYDSLEREAAAGRRPAATVWRKVCWSVERLKADAQWGEVIPTIPQYFADKYGAHCLYCIDLPSLHRLFYMIRGRRIILLDIVDHRTYDKWFPGRGR